MEHQGRREMFPRPDHSTPEEEASKRMPFYLLRNGKGPVQNIVEGSLTLEELTPEDDSGKLVAVILTAQPGFSCWEGKACGVKWYHILEGSIEVVANDVKHTLEEGDSIYLEPDISHIWRNPGETTAKALALSSPASSSSD